MAGPLGLEPKTKESESFMLPITPRPHTRQTLPRLPGEKERKFSHYILLTFGALDGIRTHTGGILSPLSLPIGLREHIVIKSRFHFS